MNSQVRGLTIYFIRIQVFYHWILQDLYSEYKSLVDKSFINKRLNLKIKVLFKNVKDLYIHIRIKDID